MYALAETFLANLKAAQRADVKADAELEERLRRCVEEANAHWPGLALPDGDYVAHLARCLADGSPADGPLDAQALDSLQTDDLYLALACARAQSRALAAFEQHFSAHIAAIVGRVLSDLATREDAEQLVRDRLFVTAPEQQPRILEYRGRGQLLAFLRVVSSRVALGLVRKQKNHEDLDDQGGWELPDRGDDPELQYLKVLYRSEFKAAFVAAIDELSPRSRTLLRYHLIDRLSIDKIAAIYSIHRATAARQIGKAKESVIQATQRALKARLQLGSDELNSILRLVEGNVDVSVRRLLVAEPD